MITVTARQLAGMGNGSILARRTDSSNTCMRAAIRFATVGPAFGLGRTLLSVIRLPGTTSAGPHDMTLQLPVVHRHGVYLLVRQCAVLELA